MRGVASGHNRGGEAGVTLSVKCPLGITKPRLESTQVGSELLVKSSVESGIELLCCQRRPHGGVVLG
jgi:hypothetical protein